MVSRYKGRQDSRWIERKMDFKEDRKLERWLDIKVNRQKDLKKYSN